LLPPRSTFAGFRFSPEGIVVAAVPALQPLLPDVEELLVERGVGVDHVAVFRLVQRFTPLLTDAARFSRRAPGDRRYVNET
jgi:transposase-like protein